MTLLGLFGYKTKIFTPKNDQIIHESNEIFLGGQKLRFFEKWPQVTLLDEFNVKKK